MRKFLVMDLHYKECSRKFFKQKEGNTSWIVGSIAKSCKYDSSYFRIRKSRWFCLLHFWSPPFFYSQEWWSPHPTPSHSFTLGHSAKSRGYFWLSQMCRRFALRIWWEEARDAAKHSTIHRIGCHNKGLSTPKCL